MTIMRLSWFNQVRNYGMGGDWNLLVRLRCDAWLPPASRCGIAEASQASKPGATRAILSLSCSSNRWQQLCLAGEHSPGYRIHLIPQQIWPWNGEHSIRFVEIWWPYTIKNGKSKVSALCWAFYVAASSVNRISLASNQPGAQRQQLLRSIDLTERAQFATQTTTWVVAQVAQQTTIVVDKHQLVNINGNTIG